MRPKYDMRRFIIIIIKMQSIKGIRNSNVSKMQFSSNEESVLVKPKPERGYYKCLQCEIFVKWADNGKCDCNKMIIRSFKEEKGELAKIRILLKLIEKAQNFMLMLLIIVFVIVSFLVVT